MNVFVRYFFSIFTLVSLYLWGEEIAYPPDISKIIDSKILRVALYDQTPLPFNSKNFEGFDNNLAKEIASSLGVTVKVIPASSFNDVVNQVALKNADVGISQISGTVERALFINVSDPYVVLTQGLLINRYLLAKLKPEKTLLKVLDVENIKIGFLRNSSYERFTADLFKRAEKVGFDSWDEVIKATNKGQITAGLVDEIVLKTLSLLYPSYILNIQTVEIKDLKDPICIVTASENTHLLAWLNIFLERKKIPTTLSEMIKKYWHLYDKTKLH
jgi:polar amino acid transport system substrate-binding protein